MERTVVHSMRAETRAGGGGDGDDRALPCLTSAGNVCFEQFKFSPL